MLYADLVCPIDFNMLLGKGPALCLFLNLADQCWNAEALNTLLLAGNSFPIGQTFWEYELLKRDFLKKKCAVFSLLEYILHQMNLFVHVCVLSIILKVEKLLAWFLICLIGFLWCHSLNFHVGNQYPTTKKWYKWTYLQNRNSHRYRKQTYGHPGVKGMEG